MKFENIAVYNIENALRGMRHPMMSHAKGDTHESFNLKGAAVVGPNDKDLAMRLIKAGEPHRKFLRQIFVSVDITAPAYWWAECDTYRVGCTRDSSSTMHKIMSRNLTMDDFAIPPTALADKLLRGAVAELNETRKRYLWFRENNENKAAEDEFLAMKHMLPSSYLYLSTWTANYEVLANIYKWRHNHRLPEWRQFCREFIGALPYPEFITLSAQGEDER